MESSVGFSLTELVFQYQSATEQYDKIPNYEEYNVWIPILVTSESESGRKRWTLRTSRQIITQEH